MLAERRVHVDAAGALISTALRALLRARPRLPSPRTSVPAGRRPLRRGSRGIRLRRSREAAARSPRAPTPRWRSRSTDLEAEVADLNAPRRRASRSTTSPRLRRPIGGIAPARPPARRRLVQGSPTGNLVGRPSTFGLRTPQPRRPSAVAVVSSARSSSRPGRPGPPAAGVPASRSRSWTWPSASSSPRITAKWAPVACRADSSCWPSLRRPSSARTASPAARSVGRDPEPLGRGGRIGPDDDRERAASRGRRVRPWPSSASRTRSSPSPNPIPGVGRPPSSSTRPS